MSNKNTDWLIDFYQAIANASPESHQPIYNFEHTFKFSDILNTFPTIEDVGYSQNKVKQLSRHYWNDSLNPFIFHNLSTGVKEFSFTPHGIPKKHGDNKNKEFCLSKVDVSVNEGTINLVMHTRASEPFQVLIADLWFFSNKMKSFADQVGMDLGTIHFSIALCKVYSFAVRSPSQIRLVKSRTPAERVEHFMKFLNCFYPTRRKLAFRMVGRYLTFFLPKINPTPTYSKLKAGHKICQELLDQPHRDLLTKKFYEMFPEDIKSLQGKRDARGDNKFPTLLKD